LDLVSNHASLDAEIDALDATAVRRIAADTTIPVSDAASLLAAMDSLSGSLLDPGVIVTISAGPGTYDFSEPLVFDHPSGERVRVLGAGAGATILSFPGSGGVYVQDGAGAWLDGVTIQGGGTGNGAHAFAGARLVLGPAVEVQGFGPYGVLAERGAVVLADGVESDSNSIGFGATWGGTLISRLAAAAGNGTRGWYAYGGGVIFAEGSTATQNGTDGFEAELGSVLNAPSASSIDNLRHGYTVAVGSSGEAFGAGAFGNAAYGFHVYTGAALNAASSISDGNGWGHVVTAGSTLSAAASASATDNLGSGLWLTSGSAALIDGMLVSGNGLHGLQMIEGSSVLAQSAAFTGNAGYGVSHQDGAIVVLDGSTVSGNGAGSYSHPAGTDPTYRR
jgi:hypothetical protein